MLSHKGIPSVQNRAFTRFRSYHCVRIAPLAPVPPPAGGLTLNCDKLTGFAEYFKNSRKIETENNNERS